MKTLFGLILTLGSMPTYAAPVENFKFNLSVEMNRCYSSEGYSSCDAPSGTGADILIPLDHCGTQPTGAYCSGMYEMTAERDGHRVQTSVLVQKFGQGETARYNLIATATGATPGTGNTVRSIEIEFHGGRLTDSVRFRGAEFTDSRDGQNVSYVPSVVIGPLGSR